MFFFLSRLLDSSGWLMVHKPIQDELWAFGNMQRSGLPRGRQLSQGTWLFGWETNLLKHLTKWAFSDFDRLSLNFSPCGTESVKDLIRYLRHEDDTRDVRQQLGDSQIVQNDLLPIIVQYRQDKTLFDACIRYDSLQSFTGMVICIFVYTVLIRTESLLWNGFYAVVSFQAHG